MTGTDRIRILIVENEGLVGCDMAASLGKLGYLVTGICASGEEALEKFDEMQPDLVLLDVHLAGEIDGIETARRLQTRSSVAILYVTACADLETVTRARETHPQGYLLKPFSHDELRLAVEVVDHFGRLRRPDLVRSLRRAASGQVNRGQGGAGIGLSLVCRTCPLVQVDVEPGSRTRLTAVIDLEPGRATEGGKPGRSIIFPDLTAHAVRLDS